MGQACWKLDGQSFDFLTTLINSEAIARFASIIAESSFDKMVALKLYVLAPETAIANVQQT